MQTAQPANWQRAPDETHCRRCLGGHFYSLAGRVGTRANPLDGSSPSAGVEPRTLGVERAGHSGYRRSEAARTTAEVAGKSSAFHVDANSADQSIWQTLNGGISWTRINDSGITNCGDFFGGCGTSQGIYDLVLAAVPNGMVTDLYAGATNLYKCTLTAASPTCSGTGSNSFLNLTHVCGCSDIAKMHPEQHAIDFLIANGTALMYIANNVAFIERSMLSQG